MERFGVDERMVMSACPRDHPCAGRRGAEVNGLAGKFVDQAELLVGAFKRRHVGGCRQRQDARRRRSSSPGSPSDPLRPAATPSRRLRAVVGSPIRPAWVNVERADPLPARPVAFGRAEPFEHWCFRSGCNHDENIGTHAVQEGEGETLEEIGVEQLGVIDEHPHGQIHRVRGDRVCQPAHLVELPRFVRSRAHTTRPAPALPVDQAPASLRGTRTAPTVVILDPHRLSRATTPDGQRKAATPGSAATRRPAFALVTTPPAFERRTRKSRLTAPVEDWRGDRGRGRPPTIETDP